MSRTLNRVTLIGNLGRDAETAYTASQVAVTKFSVATTRRWKDQKSGDWKEETDWHNIILWRGENVAPYLLKGAKVYVEGRLATRSYEKDGEKKYVTEIVSENLILLGGKDAGLEQPRGNAPSAGQTTGQIDDDDVPF